MSPCPICRRPATALYQSPARGECADPGGRGCLMLALTMAMAENGELRDALRELLAEVGDCEVEHGHHCNATGSHRATVETCAACVARELLRSRPPEEAPEPPRQSRGDDSADE